MSFSKRFPKTVKGSSYPEWVEIVLSTEEELEQEELAQKENVVILQRCIEDAKHIILPIIKILRLKLTSLILLQ